MKQFIILLLLLALSIFLLYYSSKQKNEIYNHNLEQYISSYPLVYKASGWSDNIQESECYLYNAINMSYVNYSKPFAKGTDVPNSMKYLDNFVFNMKKVQRTCIEPECIGEDGNVYYKSEIETFQQLCPQPKGFNTMSFIYFPSYNLYLNNNFRVSNNNNNFINVELYSDSKYIFPFVRIRYNYTCLNSQCQEVKCSLNDSVKSDYIFVLCSREYYREYTNGIYPNIISTDNILKSDYRNIDIFMQSCNFLDINKDNSVFMNKDRSSIVTESYIIPLKI